MRLLAFGERQPAILTVIGGVPSLVVYRHVYLASDLPRGARILIMPADHVPTDDRVEYDRLVDAARREGFDVEIEVAPTRLAD